MRGTLLHDTRRARIIIASGAVLDACRPRGPRPMILPHRPDASDDGSEEPEHGPQIGVRFAYTSSAERLNEETVIIDMHAHWRPVRRVLTRRHGRTWRQVLPATC